MPTPTTNTLRPMWEIPFTSRTRQERSERQEGAHERRARAGRPVVARGDDGRRAQPVLLPDPGGGVRFELHHAKGETDDHTWTWIPSEKVLCCGDLFIWASPNAGNPQKVQRYPREWAE